MSYRLKPQRSLTSEVKRIVDKQLLAAIEQLHVVGDQRADMAVHEARRHVKKIRAILRFVQPALGDAYYSTDQHMRNASRMLAPIADGEAVVETLAHIRKKFGSRLAQPTLASIRVVLIKRAARIDRKAQLDRVLPRVAGALRGERRRVRGWTLNAHGFHAIAPGLETSMRRARKAMARAASQSTADHYHMWRRRVKDLWFQVRLIQGRCGNALAVDERRLEALDGCLGEYHNVVLLERILTMEALVSRAQTARCLRVLRRYQRVLRRRAMVQGRRIFKEKPRHFVRRIKRVWRPVTDDDRANSGRARAPSRRPT